MCRVRQESYVVGKKAFLARMDPAGTECDGVRWACACDWIYVRLGERKGLGGL